MKDIVIVGSSGLAKEIAFLLKDCNKAFKEWNLLGYVDFNKGEKVGDNIVVMNDDELLKYSNELHVIISVGFPDLLKRLALKFQANPNLKFPNIIHPNCTADWKNIELGLGNIFTAGNILTTDIKIGYFNIFNLNCTTGHNSNIGNYNVINPSCNISGNVSLASEILIGTGTQILQNLKICDNVIIGAGAVVTKPITEVGVYVGTPVKKIK